MQKIFVVFFTALLMNACTLPSSQTKLVFMDTNTFDSDLSRSMSANPDSITVSMVGDVSINKIPPRLNTWLGAVKDKEGSLDVKAEPEESKKRSLALLVAVVTALPGFYSQLKTWVSYRDTSHYNAQIYYDSKTSKINKIVFHKKKPTSE
ncbi:MAG: hypothetical protein KAH77_11495 [Thiomargarita sp.]|nr:hypothetical protein [Thiomargarita sp.]